MQTQIASSITYKAAGRFRAESRGLLAGMGVAVIGLSLALVEAQAATPSYQFKALAYIGTPIPGGGVFTNDFEPDTLNDFGVLAFTAEPVQPGSEGIFVAAPGRPIQQIMRFGQSAPGTGGRVFSNGEMGNLGLNLRGDVAFSFFLDPVANTWDSGTFYWSHTTHTLTPVLVPGTPAPGGGTFLGGNFFATLNNFGLIGFSGFINTPSGPQSGAYVRRLNGPIQKIAAPGDPAPGGGTFGYAMAPFLNDYGDAVFDGHVAGSSVADQYYLKLTGGTISPIPLPAGVVGLGNVAINDRREVMFGGAVVPYTVQLGIGSIYLYRGGTTKTLASVGGPAPGGRTFSCITGANLSGQSSLNNSGDVAFEAAATNATGQLDEAIYLYSNASRTLSRIAGTGTVIPGVGTIASLEQSGTLIFGAPPPPSGIPVCNAALNDWGQISFAASVTVPDGSVTKGALLLATPEDEDDQNQDEN